MNQDANNIGDSALRSPALIALLVTAFFVALGFGLVVPIIPTFARELDATLDQAAAVVSVFALVRLASSAPAGWVSDRVGSRKLIIAGLLIVAASSAAVITADSYWDLLVLRGIGGVGSAAFVVGMGQYLILTIPNRERGRAQGLLQGSFLMGGASGPAVGGLLVDAFGLTAPFLIYAITLGIAAVIAMAYIVDVRGERSSPEADRALLGQVFANRTFWIAMFMALTLNWATQGIRSFAVSVYGIEDLDMTAGQVGWYLTVAALVHAVVLIPGSQAIDRLGRRPMARAGLLIYVVAVAMMAISASQGQLLIALIIQGVAIGVVSSVPAAVIADVSPGPVAGRIVGFSTVARDIG
ncbi:MAG: MFS transporter, partial [Acidimicrobiia bacterium]|nr:MFS transporter [Acidimicrobiia bacterium]